MKSQTANLEIRDCKTIMFQNTCVGRPSFTGKQLTRLSTPSGVEMYVWMSIAALEIDFHLAPPPVVSFSSLFFPSKEISCVSSSGDKLPR